MQLQDLIFTFFNDQSQADYFVQILKQLYHKVEKNAIKALLDSKD